MVCGFTFFHISSRSSILFPSIFQFDLIAFVADDDREILKLRIGDELDCIIVTTEEVRHTKEDFFFSIFVTPVIISVRRC